MSFNNSLTPIRSHQPVRAFDQAPDNTVGNDGEVALVGGVSIPGIYRKANGKWQFWQSIGGNNANGSNMNTVDTGAGSGATGGGINVSAITANNGGTYPAQIQVSNVPANSMGPNGQMDIEFEVSCTNSAGVKTFAIYFGGQLLYTQNLSNVASYSGIIRVRNGGALNSQIVNVMTSDGQSTTAFKTTNVDTSIDQIVQMFGSTNVVNDAISLSGFSVSTRMNPTLPVSQSPLVPGKKIFYGINHHPGYYLLTPPALMIQLMNYMKFSSIRLDYEGNNLSQIQLYAQALQLDTNGYQMYCVMGNCSMTGPDGNAFANEAAAYAWNYANSFACAQGLIPLGVRLFGAANEIDAANAGTTNIRPTTSSNGTNAADFISALFPLLRGAVNGSTDGLRAAAKAAGVQIQVGSPALTNSSILISDALWNGCNLDGTSGFQPCRWDFTDWHTYSGDLSIASYSGVPPPTFNLLAYITKAYGGRPIVISEFNGTTQNVHDWMTTWYQNQVKYNIASVMFYDAFDQPYNAFNAADGPWQPSNMTANGLALQAFINANPAQR